MTVQPDNKKLLTVSPSPHLRGKDTTASIMMDVIIALTPAAVWGVYVFGTRALILLVVCILTSIVSEGLTQRVLHRSVTIEDLSAAVTGMLLAFNLPVTLPIWMAMIGSVFAIVVVKQLFGGIGKNFMNPALAGRVFLTLSFAGSMTNFTAAYDRVWFSAADVVASATPLASLKAGVLPEASLFDVFFGRTGGCIGEVSTFLLLAGGIYLLCRKVISWRIPVTYLATVALLSFAFARADGARWLVMLYELCTGGLMLGAFFMATDYVTCPVTKWGKIVFGVGCGALTVFIRTFGGYPEGVSYSILIMNALVWYLDVAFRPRVFGKQKGKVARRG
jgi:electron transport complex protein RnfD